MADYKKLKPKVLKHEGLWLGNEDGHFFQTKKYLRTVMII